MDKDVRRKIVVSYLGPKGTFCEQAARKHFNSKEATFIPCLSIAEVFKAVEENVSEYGVVPVENSLEGSIHLTLDQLLETDLSVCGEVELRIEHNLIVKSGTRMETIKLIISHAQAFGQCRRFIEKNLPKADIREVSSTAKAVEMLNSLENAAAIGPETAAENSGMEILIKGIEDSFDNFTRFFILNKKDAPCTGKDKTSIIFSAKHTPGSLFKILEAFAIRGINLTKIESRPERGKPWEYIFYLDFEGHRMEDKNREALEQLVKNCIFLKVLGSYPKTLS